MKTNTPSKRLSKEAKLANIIASASNCVIVGADPKQNKHLDKRNGNTTYSYAFAGTYVYTAFLQRPAMVQAA